MKSLSPTTEDELYDYFLAIIQDYPEGITAKELTQEFNEDQPYGLYTKDLDGRTVTSVLRIGEGSELKHEKGRWSLLCGM